MVLADWKMAVYAGVEGGGVGLVQQVGLGEGFWGS